jgi:hypothetical protein
MQLNLAPGVFVRCPAHPEWGLGQVQSAAGDRVTVNFENAGKLALNAALVALEPADPADSASATSTWAPR